MKKPLLFALAALVLFAGMSSSAHAQTTMYGPVYNQPVSPYLNILRGGAIPALNYYNIVQPQLQFESQIGLLQQQTGALYGAAASGRLGPGEALSTGHPVQFGNLSHYYGSGLGAGGGSTGAGLAGGGMINQGGFPGLGGGGAMGLGIGR